MFHEKRVTIPPNTPKTSPKRVRWKLREGTIYYVEVFFPAGCHQLAHLCIYHEEHQVWPSNPDEDFSGEDDKISFTEAYDLKKGASELVLIAWNEDDTYSHTVTVRVGLLPKWLAIPAVLIKRFVDTLSRLIGLG